MINFIKIIFFTIIFSISFQSVLSYTQDMELSYSQYIFSYNITPAGFYEGQIQGFEDPICEKIAYWDSQIGILYAKVFAMTPLTSNKQYRPNAKVLLELWYNGTFNHPFSYVKSYLLSPNLYVINHHIPYDLFGNLLGYAEYGYTTSELRTSGNVNYSIRIASLYALADYWFPNNEVFHDYAEANVMLTISNAILEFHWTEISSIYYSPNPTIGIPTIFTIAIKDGVPPYTIKWNFENQELITKVEGKIDEIVYASTSFTFSSPGIYNLTITVIDSMGILDEKWILINVNAIYLTIQTSLGGTTNPSPGTYMCIKGQQIQVNAQPYSGYTLGWWELDNIVSGDMNPFTIIMNQNHTLKAIFIPTLSVLLIANPLSGFAPLNVTFDCIAIGGNPPYKYYLEFGDMGIFITQSSSVIQTWHIYSQAGNYTVNLKVIDSMGRKGYASINIIVKNSQELVLILSKTNDIVITPGQIGITTIIVNASIIEPVQLSIQWIGNIPIDSITSLSSTSIIPNSTSILTIFTTKNTPPGNYTCRVIGTMGKISAYVDIEIIINPSIYYLTILSSEGGITNPMPGVYAYPAGVKVQIQAYSFINYSFLAWKLNNNIVSGNDIITIFMDNNYTVQAIFSQLQLPQSSLIINVKYFESGIWKTGTNKNPIEFNSYGVIRWNETNIELISPIIINASLGLQIPIQFDPINTEGKLLSIGGGNPKSKIWSVKLYTNNYNEDISPSIITYPSYYQAIILPSSTILEIKLKWMDYPINISCNAPWGKVYVTSNSPGWSLYNYDYENGFGIYYVDYGYKISIKAIAFTGYYLDKIEIDGISYYNDFITIENVKEPHEVKVYFSTIPPTFNLTIIATEGGTTIPSPGVYAVPRYSTQSIIAKVVNSSYYFIGWNINGIPISSSENISIFMNEDKVVIANFDSDIISPVGPCSLINGNMFKRVFIDEIFGINVTWQIPGITQPKQVKVIAWLESVEWWDGKEIKNTEYKFTGITTTDSTGKFTIKFGSFESIFYTTSKKAKIGDIYYAYANVTIDSNTYNLVSTWKIDALMPWPSFSYNLTGVNVNISFRYFTDGTFVKGREGYYAASISIYDPMEGGEFKIERLSTPCDNNGFSYLFIPYSEMKITRKDIAEIIVWDAIKYYPIVSTIRTNITYTTITSMIYFFNNTHMIIEPIDWGELKPIEGVYAYLYWDTYDYLFNGSNGLIGIFGPSKNFPIIKSEWQGYKAYLNISGIIWPISNNILINPLKNFITAITIQYPDFYKIMYNNTNPPRRFYLFLIPSLSEGILYNPIIEMPDLIIHRPEEVK
ncbi:MAG: hypothetical protein QXY96_04545 [Candidatus Methanomethylicaceae archaeon]